MCRCVGFFHIGLTWKFIIFAMLLQTSKCGKNLVLEIWIKMLHDIMVMSIFLKWMAGSNDRGRWQGGVIASILTFSFFQSFLLTTKAKKQKRRERVFHPRKHLNFFSSSSFILTYLPFSFCWWYGEFFFILNTRNMENFNCADRKYFSWPNFKKLKLRGLELVKRQFLP